MPDNYFNSDGPNQTSRKSERTSKQCAANEDSQPRVHGLLVVEDDSSITSVENQQGRTSVGPTSQQHGSHKLDRHNTRRSEAYVTPAVAATKVSQAAFRDERARQSTHPQAGKHRNGSRAGSESSGWSSSSHGSLPMAPRGYMVGFDRERNQPFYVDEVNGAKSYDRPVSKSGGDRSSRYRSTQRSVRPMEAIIEDGFKHTTDSGSQRLPDSVRLQDFNGRGLGGLKIPRGARARVNLGSLEIDNDPKDLKHKAKLTINRPAVYSKPESGSESGSEVPAESTNLPHKKTASRATKDTASDGLSYDSVTASIKGAESTIGLEAAILANEKYQEEKKRIQLALSISRRDVGKRRQRKHALESPKRRFMAEHAESASSDEDASENSNRTTIHGTLDNVKPSGNDRYVKIQGSMTLPPGTEFRIRNTYDYPITRQAPRRGERDSTSSSQSSTRASTRTSHKSEHSSNYGSSRHEATSITTLNRVEPPPSVLPVDHQIEYRPATSESAPLTCSVSSCNERRCNEPTHKAITARQAKRTRDYELIKCMPFTSFIAGANAGRILKLREQKKAKELERKKAY